MTTGEYPNQHTNGSSILIVLFFLICSVMCVSANRDTNPQRPIWPVYNRMSFEHDCWRLHSGRERIQPAATHTTQSTVRRDEQHRAEQRVRVLMGRVPCDSGAWLSPTTQPHKTQMHEHLSCLPPPGSWWVITVGSTAMSLEVVYLQQHSNTFRCSGEGPIIEW